MNYVCEFNESSCIISPLFFLKKEKKKGKEKKPIIQTGKRLAQILESIRETWYLLSQGIRQYKIIHEECDTCHLLVDYWISL